MLVYIYYSYTNKKLSVLILRVKFSGGTSRIRTYISVLVRIKYNSVCLPSHHSPKNGAPGGIRTPDPRIRNPLLYPTELLAHINLLMIKIGAQGGIRTHDCAVLQTVAFDQTQPPEHLLYILI